MQGLSKLLKLPSQPIASKIPVCGHKTELTSLAKLGIANLKLSAHKSGAGTMNEIAPARYPRFYKPGFWNMQYKVRIGATPLIRKAALELRCAPTLAAKSQSTKSIILFQGMDSMGVTRSLQSLSGWRCRYTRFRATMRPRQRITASVGATADPRHRMRGKHVRACRKVIPITLRM